MILWFFNLYFRGILCIYPVTFFAVKTVPWITWTKYINYLGNKLYFLTAFINNSHFQKNFFDLFFSTHRGGVCRIFFFEKVLKNVFFCFFCILQTDYEYNRYIHRHTLIRLSINVSTRYFTRLNVFIFFAFFMSSEKTEKPLKTEKRENWR